MEARRPQQSESEIGSAPPPPPPRSRTERGDASGPGGQRGAPRWVWWAVAGVAVLVVVVVLIVVLSSGDDDSKTGKSNARSTSAAELVALSRSLGRPIYWAGPPAPQGTLELTEAGGNVYVRYLPAGVNVGDPAQYPTIGTYPYANAFDTVKRVSRQPGRGSVKAPKGAVASFTRSRPTSVYMAFPGVDELVEVYDPNAAAARKLAESGQVRPVGQ